MLTIPSYRNQKQQVKTARGRKNSSILWLNRSLNDQYTALAKKNGYRSRSAFKLIEIDQKFSLLKNAKCIIDLGSAPGGWLQVAQQQSKNSIIIGVDIKQIEPIEGIISLQGDFLKESTIKFLEQNVGQAPDLIMSDMAAAACGDPTVDHIRSITLAESACEFALKHLKVGGSFIVKILKGGQEEKLIKGINSYFTKVKFFKPQSSYSISSEVYIISIKKIK